VRKAIQDDSRDEKDRVNRIAVMRMITPIDRGVIDRIMVEITVRSSKIISDMINIYMCECEFAL